MAPSAGPREPTQCSQGAWRSQPAPEAGARRKRANSVFARSLEEPTSTSSSSEAQDKCVGSARPDGACLLRPVRLALHFLLSSTLAQVWCVCTSVHHSLLRANSMFATSLEQHQHRVCVSVLAPLRSGSSFPHHAPSAPTFPSRWSLVRCCTDAAEATASSMCSRCVWSLARGDWRLVRRNGQRCVACVACPAVWKSQQSSVGFLIFIVIVQPSSVRLCLDP